MDGRLNELFKARLPHFHFQRVETAGTGLGIPDLNYCARGTEGWLELKAMYEGWRVPLRPEQCAWHGQRIRAGGIVYTAVRRKVEAGPRRQACDDLYLFCGCKSQTLIISSLIDVTHNGCWHGGPAKWDWTAVGLILTTRCNH